MLFGKCFCRLHTKYSCEIRTDVNFSAACVNVIQKGPPANMSVTYTCSSSLRADVTHTLVCPDDCGLSFNYQQ